MSIPIVLLKLRQVQAPTLSTILQSISRHQSTSKFLLKTNPKLCSLQFNNVHHQLLLLCSNLQKLLLLQSCQFLKSTSSQRSLHL